MLKILLVDDDAIVRQSLKLVLADVTTQVDEAGSANEALHMALADRWDAVILDMLLPDGNGVAVLNVLKRERPTLPVLIVSLHDDRFYVRGALKAGAAGYVRKETVAEELVPALHRVLEGGRYLSPNLEDSPQVH